MEDQKFSIRDQILSRLMLSSSLKYSQLELGIDNHDLFNYHLKELQKQDLICKTSRLDYELTVTGRQQVASMEEDGTSQKPFKVGIFIALIRKNNQGEYQSLLYKRLKHPHYGYSGDISGKLKWGDSLEDNLQRELEEELEIRAVNYALLGTVKKSFRGEDNRIMGEGVYFQYVVTQFIGEPRLKSVEGEYFWCQLDQVLNQEYIFRETLEYTIPKIQSYLDNPKKFHQFVVEQGTEQLKY